ncbi:MAG: LysM peptidoglycan-binding domain-containing M23 family metallopeptidase [Candidatus Omnitrophota bacterium]
MNSKRLGWLFFFILLLLISGCSFKFSLNPAETAPSGIYHTVQKGETLWRIGQAYGSSVSAIKDANNLKSDEIKIGQRLLIPHAKETKKIPPFPQPRAGQPPKPPVIIKPVPKKTIGTPVFSWPLSGKILSTTEEAEREKKIGIEGKPGETIITSRAGQVFFTGETKGYSSTLIVDHLDGFYSVYGGDIEITVHKGERLAKNGIIGKMISTREKPKLFFEIRQGTEPVNPLNYLNK